MTDHNGKKPRRSFDLHVFENRDGKLCVSATLPGGQRTKVFEFEDIFSPDAAVEIEDFCLELAEDRLV